MPREKESGEEQFYRLQKEAGLPAENIQGRYFIFICTLEQDRHHLEAGYIKNTSVKETKCSCGRTVLSETLHLVVEMPTKQRALDCIYFEDGYWHIVWNDDRTPDECIGKIRLV